MRRRVVAAIIYLLASPIAFADFKSDDKDQPPGHDRRSIATVAPSEGTLVPATVVLVRIPPEYDDGYGTYEAYRFTVLAGRPVVVDPGTRRVIGLLR